MTTNEFERNLNDQSGLKRPGRIDLRVFQNTADAGDGHPGLQRAFRNYLHEGGMEKDLDLIGYSIKGTSVLIDNAELQQLSNIGTKTITNDQWGYVGGADQPVKIADSPTFGGLSVNGNITITGNVDGVDISDSINQDVRTTATPSFTGLSLTGNLALAANSITGSSVNINNAELQQLSLIGTATILGTQWAFLGNMDQDIRQTDSPTFVGLTLSADLVTTSTIDSVNISTFKTDYDTHKASTGADHTYIDQSVIITASPTFDGLTLGSDLITTSTIDGVDVSAHVHSGAGQGGTVDHVNLSNKGTKTHSEIDTHLGDKCSHPSVTPMSWYGANGFIKEGSFGSSWSIVCSDTDADMYATFHVAKAGTYKLHIVTRGTAIGATSYAGGRIYIGVIQSGGYITWNVADNQNWDLAVDDQVLRFRDDEYTTAITTTEYNVFVYVRWHKDDNMGTRSGNLLIAGMYLERTA